MSPTLKEGPKLAGGPLGTRQSGGLPKVWGPSPTHTKDASPPLASASWLSLTGGTLFHSDFLPESYSPSRTGCISVRAFEFMTRLVSLATGPDRVRIFPHVHLTAARGAARQEASCPPSALHFSRGNPASPKPAWGLERGLTGAPESRRLCCAPHDCLASGDALQLSGVGRAPGRRAELWSGCL